MPLVVSTDIITTANSDHAIDNGNQSVYVAAGVLVAAQGFNAYGVYSPSYIQLTVAGEIYGTGSGVYGADGTANIRVNTGGSISSDSYAVLLSGDGTIRNDGFIGGSVGIGGGYAGTRFTITNSGTIMGGTGITLSPSNANAETTIRNSGTISGSSNALLLSAGGDTVINSGALLGNVYMGSGDDYFDSQAGIVDSEVSGQAGDDILIGSAFDDVLNGGAGADEMHGGAGSDTISYNGGNGVYFDLQNGALNTGDAAGDIWTSMENITGSSFVDQIFGDAIGNRIDGRGGDDRLDGRGGNDVLDGGFGADRMTGGAGNDIFYVDNIADVVIEAFNQGNDEVRSTISYSLQNQYVEKLTLLGSAAINATGNAYDNIIVGNDAANVLEGRLGKDILTGKSGADQFVMTGAPGAANMDRITDFAPTVDKIVIDKSYYAQIGALGDLAPAAFKVIGDTIDASDRILYNASTGILYYDADGSGAAAVPLAFAQVTAGLALSASDFLIVA